MENAKSYKSSVQEFQNEVNTLAAKYIKSVEIKEVKRYLPKDKFDLENIIYGLWYYFVIHTLSSKTAHTITAYEYGALTLEQIMEGKIWLLQNWTEDILFEEFNDFVHEQIRWKEARSRWLVQTSLQSFSIDGRDWILKLHNDEKIKIIEKLLATEIVKEEDQKEYIERINELEEYRQKSSLEVVIDTVKKDHKQYKQLVVRYEEIAVSDKKFLKKNGEVNYTKIANFIKKLNPRKLDLRTISQALLRYRRELGKVRAKGHKKIPDEM